VNVSRFLVDVQTTLPRGPVNSVVQAVTILRHLGTRADGAGVTAIARATGISPSSCYNVLRTLVSEDLASFDPATKRYALGLGLVDLARSMLAHDAAARVAEKPMAALAERHEAAVGLWRLSGDRLVLVALAESEAATRIHMAVGQRQPATAGASGRAVLAASRLSDEALLAAYASVRWSRPPGAETFLSQVREAEARGWADDIGNVHHGIETVAAGVPDRDGGVRLVLSASVFGGRETAEGMRRIGAELYEAAQAIGRTVDR